MRLRGSRPHRKLVRAVQADPACAQLHPDGMLSDDLVVGPANQVSGALVFVTKGLEGRRFEAPALAVDLRLRGCRYQPRVIGVQVDQAVEFHNEDPLLHHVHGLPERNLPFGFGLLRGATVRRTFGRPEILQVACDVHPWDRAWIGVFDHPYFAVTDADGRYTIKGLPPGKYSLEVWHETLKAAEVQIAVEGKETKVPVIELVAKP